MTNTLKNIAKIFVSFGLNPLQFLLSFRGIPSFISSYIKIRKQLSASSSKDFKIARFYPILADKYMESGVMKGHYFHQDLFVASRIFQTNPVRHIDIGSRIDGFVAHIASFRAIEIFDIRPLNSEVPNIVFRQVDLSAPISEKYLACTDSISCLHAIEHFGLGRYGDSIDIDGHLKGLDNITKFLTPNGRLYFSTPIGPQRIEFNAHRVFGVSYLLNYFNTNYNIISFSYVDDAGSFFQNANLTDSAIKNNFNCQYGCGIFELQKK